MSASSCPFCPPDPESIISQGDGVTALWDAYPVSPGHALLIPNRHIATWFEASSEEQAELLGTISDVADQIDQRHHPDGFNIGINIGAAAGQTVFHLHIHVIPRYAYDVPHPRGGVRHVIPQKANYLDAAVVNRSRMAEPRSPGLVTEALERGAPHVRALIAGGNDPLLPHVRAHLDRSQRADFAVAFVLESGMELLQPHLVDLVDRGGQVRFLTGDYLGVTDPGALVALLDFANLYPAAVDVRVFETRGGSFHPKSYIFYADRGGGVALVGSSNLTRTALTSGVEWNYRTVTSRDHAGFNDAVTSFEALFHRRGTRTLDRAWIEQYRTRRTRPPLAPEPQPPPPQPHSIQQRALDALHGTRGAGNTAGLVVLATGLGKTWLAAFDSARLFKRVLFVAHREEILQQALATFRRIRPQATLGLFTGREKMPDADVVFASIQTLSRLRNLRGFDYKEFDYVVVDEFHHASAQTYRRVIDYFEPRFMLGLTATPERTDGGDLLALCQENLVFRADLHEGIAEGLLSPFSYYGVPDLVDYTNIPWRSRRFDEEALTTAVATEARADNALEQYRARGGARTLAFCCSQRHANFMRDHFRAAGIRAAAVHSGDSSDPRATSLEQLKDGDLDAVFAVDMFNEGVDVPSLDTVMMLRPTESRILWLQQFGRGLRVAEGKERLTVIDYIGNHRTFLLKPQTLFDLPVGDSHIERTLNLLGRGDAELPPGCELTYDLEAVEIIRALLRTPQHEDVLRFAYEDFRDRHRVRPSATEFFHEGYKPRAARKGYGSWFGFVEAMGDLSDVERSVTRDGRTATFLASLETTPMTRSFKMLLMLAMLGVDTFPGSITIEQLRDGVRHFAKRNGALRADFGEALEDDGKLTTLLEMNPIKAWTGAKGTGGVAYFRYEDGVLSTTFEGNAPKAEFSDLTRELVDWRLRRIPDSVTAR